MNITAPHEHATDRDADCCEICFPAPVTDDQAVPLPPGAAPDDPLCMHCRQALTPCTCWRGRGCEHNGWTHIRAGTHECPGMATKAYLSSESLRDRLRATAPDVPPEAIFAFRTGMGAWYADSITDQAIGRGLLAAADVLRAQGAATERERIRAYVTERIRELQVMGWTGQGETVPQSELRKVADLLDGTQ